jgi:hypothetical protein
MELQEEFGDLAKITTKIFCKGNILNFFNWFSHHIYTVFVKRSFGIRIIESHDLAKIVRVGVGIVPDVNFTSASYAQAMHKLCILHKHEIEYYIFLNSNLRARTFTSARWQDRGRDEQADPHHCLPDRGGWVGGRVLLQAGQWARLWSL